MPSPTLEVRHFSLVNEIASTGSVTRAAERLHLTQSALSHQLRDIESRLGIQLFLRLGKKMVRVGDKVEIYDLDAAKPFGPLQGED